MTTFDDREKAFEGKSAHSAEMQLRAEARRNKLLGLWAAELLGKRGTDADDYAKEVVMSDIEEAGDEDVLRKVYADLDAAGVTITTEILRQKMDALIAVARQQLNDE
jgi:hypothetical protein